MLRIDNQVVQVNSLRYFKKMSWYKCTVYLIPPYRVPNPAKTRIRLLLTVPTLIYDRKCAISRISCVYMYVCVTCVCVRERVCASVCARVFVSGADSAHTPSTVIPHCWYSVWIWKFGALMPIDFHERMRVYITWTHTYIYIYIILHWIHIYESKGVRVPRTQKGRCGGRGVGAGEEGKGGKTWRLEAPRSITLSTSPVFLLPPQPHRTNSQMWHLPGDVPPPQPACTHALTHAHTRTHTRTHTHTHTQSRTPHTHNQICMRAQSWCVCVCIFECMCASVWVRVYVHVCACVCARRFACMDMNQSTDLENSVGVCAHEAGWCWWVCVCVWRERESEREREREKEREREL